MVLLGEITRQNSIQEAERAKERENEKMRRRTCTVCYLLSTHSVAYQVGYAKTTDTEGSQHLSPDNGINWIHDALIHILRIRSTHYTKSCDWNHIEILSYRDGEIELQIIDAITTTTGRCTPYNMHGIAAYTEIGLTSNSRLFTF